MTGGGFGGCVVAVVEPRAVDAVAEQLLRGYEQRFGPGAEAYRVSTSDGAGEIGGPHG